MSVLTFSLDGLPPSPNATRRLHFHQRADESRTWRDAAYLSALAAVSEAGIADDLPWERVVVTLRFRLSRWTHDLDNLMAGCKPIIDGIARGFVIPTDGPSHLVELRGTLERGRDGVTVEVRRL